MGAVQTSQSTSLTSNVEQAIVKEDCGKNVNLSCANQLIHQKLLNVFNPNCNDVFVIAEGCDNHLGSIENAKKMVDLAYGSGADAIKFQHHLPDEEMLREIPMSDNFDVPLYEFLQENALSLDMHVELKSYCDKVGIIYLCTPFSAKAAAEISDLVPFFKIGSGEMLDFPSLRRITAINNSLILSTGMSTLDEIESAVQFLGTCGATFALLHCISEYPPIYEDMNIGVIDVLRQKYKHISVGFSDHTQDIFLSVAAVAKGAKIIEKHVTLNKSVKCPDQMVSIDFEELKSLTKQIRSVSAALGSNKLVHKRESDIRRWAHRSIVSTTMIYKGDVLTEANITTKRPGIGIPARRFDNILGCIAIKDIGENQLLCEEDFCKDAV